MNIKDYKKLRKIIEDLNKKNMLCKRIKTINIKYKRDIIEGFDWKLF